MIHPVTRLQRRFLRVAAAFNFRSMGVYILYGVVVGVVAGLGAAMFYWMCQAGLH
jgi:hypothetical protein